MYILTQDVSKWKQINFRNIDSMLSVQFLYDLYDQYDAKINWFRFKNVCLFYQDDKLWSYTPKNDWEKALDNIADQFKNPDKFSNPEIIDNCYNYCKIEKKLLKKLLADIDKMDLEKLSNEELYNLLFKWYQTTLNQIYYINVAPVELGLQRAIKQLSEKANVSTEDMGVLYSLEDNTEVLKEELALLKTLAKNNYKYTNKILNLHLKEFKHLTVGYGSSEMDLETVKTRFDNAVSMGKDAIDSRIKTIEAYPEEILKRKVVSRKNIEDKHLVGLYDLAAKMGLLRDQNKAFLGKSVTYRNRIMEVIAKKNNMVREDFKYYMMDDMKAFLCYGEKLDEAEIARRAEGVYISHVSMLYSGADSRENYYRAVKSDENETLSIEDVKGICASPGHAKGIAKVCLTFEECNKLKDNEILVTYGTDFNFLNAMVKSAAIVTEEGGILSHASVISRELKKPCVIGFKGATKLIEDGDEIEVDASNATVKILKKAHKKATKKVELVGVHDMKEKLEADEIGNKAYNLNVLSSNGFNIPKAYTLGVSFFKDILKKNDKYDEYIDYVMNIRECEEQVYELIDSLVYPTEEIASLLDFEHNTYAVRSSSLCEDGFNKSFAGQFVTELFCNSIDFVMKSIKTCWKSFLNKNLEVYAGDEKNCFGAIVIQKMVTANYSGVLFTKDPVSGENKMIVECCEGVAAKLVDNKVDPSRFYVDKETFKIIDKENDINIPEKYIIKLAKVSEKIQKVYGVEVDIEWAVENGELFIIQCRPITTFNADL